MKLLAAILAALTLLGAPAFAQSEWDGVERVVTIADLEGDYERFTDSLQNAGLIDSAGRWTGGRAHLVQLGDVPDRGPHSRRIMDHLMRLEREAARAGGHVHALIGNHETMNVTGDLRYVHPGEYEAFVTRSSRRERDRYWRQTVEALRSQPNPPVIDDAFRAQWETTHPLGYVEHRRAWSVEGEYGRWIARHNAIIRINDTLYAHGGLGPAFFSFDLEAINEAIRRALREGEQTEGPFAGILTSDQGPLWHRAYALGEEAAEAGNLDPLLARHRAQRFIVGHTKRAPFVFPRFGGRLIIADIAEPAGYPDPHAYVLQENGAIFAVHRGQRVPLIASTPAEFCAYSAAILALDPPSSPIANFREACAA
ncbi:MAG: metallophosphoesterase [Hyphomonadaceae bacterium]